MTKTIDTLVKDIYDLLEGTSEVEITDEEAFNFGHSLAEIIKHRVSRTGQPAVPTIRMSNAGENCQRKLWYSINDKDNLEKLPPNVRLKFLFGDILECLLLFLAKKAGHTVEGEQDEMVYEGVVGHRDAVVDGVLVDVKSASTYSFKKFEEGLNDHNDAFGYRTQLGLYLESSQQDPLVRDKTQAAFFVVDKTLGNLTLSFMPRDKSIDWKTKIAKTKDVIASKAPPPRAYMPEDEGKSGNKALGTNCSYCSAKATCWPGMRTFLYSNGPKFLTHVAKLPNVMEVT